MISNVTDKLIYKLYICYTIKSIETLGIIPIP